MSTIPVVYNLESLRARWRSAVVAVLGIAGTVAVFVAVLALARGFQATLVASGSPDNAIVRRAGATSEMDSVVTREAARVVEDLPGVRRRADGSAVTSGEVVVVASLPLRATQTDANVQVRGVSPQVRDVRTNLELIQGRFFQSGLPELVVGRHAATTYAGLDHGARVRFGGIDWTVVGVFKAGGSAYESEVWCDADLLNQAYQRPRSLSQSLTVRLESPAALQTLRDKVKADPRLEVQVDGEVEYYAKSSRMLTQLIEGLGVLVVLVMGVGAVFGALNTMYSAVAERGREVATLRALGFGGGSVVASFVFEALLVAGVGGLLGCLAALPLNGLTTGTMNWQTFSHLSFAFRVTPDLLLLGVVFALLMGVLGGVPPAVRAARLPVAAALRDL
jgi:putative ABC transport system permease protein